MKISEKWLRERVALDGIDTATLVEGLTMAGLEVDTTEPAGDDTIIAIDLTPNRGDCLGMDGITREVAAIFSREGVVPAPSVVSATHEQTFPVTVDAPADCPVYCGRVIEGVDNSRATPDWLLARLESAGLRSVDAVVDITNYVMLETGQPLHAFDLDVLKGGIHVRRAKVGEKLRLLDGNEVELRADTLLICDEQAPLALAGVMGGEHSGVSATTSRVFLESAHFSPLSIAGQARSYGLSTDSSHRFERGVDAALPARAIERATELLLEITGGQAGPVTTTASAVHQPQRNPVQVRLPRLRRILELEDADDVLLAIFTRLGMQCAEEKGGDGSWQVTPPGWRFDIEREEDLIEEVARIKGYNTVGLSWPAGAGGALPVAERKLELPALRRHLAGRGFYEAITYSFVSPVTQQLLHPGEAAVQLANPISEDMSVMRLDLWSGLLGVLKTHQSRQSTRTRLFETGLVFLPDGELPKQPPRIGLLLAGNRHPRNCTNPPAATVDLFDLKGDIESLLALTGQADAFEFVAAQHPALHPGQTARILLNQSPVGWLGTLHPRIQDELELQGPVLLAELDQECLTTRRLPAYAPISRHPEVRRDLAVVVDSSVPADALLKTVREVAGSALRDLTVFDVYQGEGIEKERKSVAFTLTFQHSSHTLSEEEVTSALGRVLEKLRSEHGASVRS